MSRAALKEGLEFCRAGAEITPLAPEIIQGLLDPEVPETFKRSLLIALNEKGETAAELAALAKAILPKAEFPGVQGSWNERPLLDCCGTGGGGLAIVNISTAMVFILAAAGVPVVKHGNRGLTKKSGSADVLKALGIEVELPPQRVGECLEKVGAAFLYAPAFHPSFRVMAPVRQALAAEGRRTVFNLLGPLLNPCRPETQMVGVFRPEHLDLFSEALKQLGCKRSMVVYGTTLEGRPLGEVSAHGLTTMMGWLGDSLFHDTVKCSREEPATLESLRVESAEESAHRIEELFEGGSDAFLRALVVENAAVALWVNGAVTNVEAGRHRASEVLDSGGARRVLRLWRGFSQTL